MAIKVVLFVGEWQSADLDAAKALAVKELDCLAAEVLDSIRDALEEQLVIKMVSFPANEWIEVASNDVVSSAEVEEAAQTREAIKLHSITSLPCLLITDIGHTVVYRHSITVHLNEIASTDGTKPVDTESVFTAGIRQYEDLHLAQAAASFYSVLRIAPAHQKAMFNLACILHAAALPSLAMGYLHSILLQNHADHIAHSFLWNIASSAPCEGAKRIYEDLDAAGDVQAGMRLAALTNTGKHASNGNLEYIKGVFNHLAGSFEDKLVSHLQYQAPWLLHQMVCQHLRAAGDEHQGDLLAMTEHVTNQRILDLGCGSGLCGKIFQHFFPLPAESIAVIDPAPDLQPLLRELSNEFGWMLGVDISDQMVQIAAKLGTYRAVLAADIGQVMEDIVTYNTSNSPILLDMVLSADTFIYVGALGKMFATIWRILRAGGLFAFSTEDLDSSAVISTPTCTRPEEVVWDGHEPVGAVAGWGVRLSRSVRYAHSPSYIDLLAGKYGFAVINAERHVLRTEEGLPIMGYMYLLVKE